MFIISAIVAALDQYCKKIASQKLPQGSYKEIKKDLLYFANLKNKGLAYGRFSNNRKVVLGASAISMGVLTFLVANPERKRKGSLYNFALALILGGGISNIFDRVVKGQVTDYIYVKAKNAPVFNIADMGVTVGFILAAISELRQ